MAMASLATKTRRGDLSWKIFYGLFAALVGLEGSIIQIAQPPYGLAIFLLSVAVTGWLVLANGPTQNKILGWKAKLESVWR